MIKKLDRKRKTILAKMGEITSLRQGSLTEQYVTRGDAKNRRRHGPYYVRTWYKDGEKHTEHISQDEARKMEANIKNYQKLKDLFEELLDVIEQQTISSGK